MDRKEAFESISIRSISLHLAWSSVQIMVDDVDDVSLIIAGDDDDVIAMKVSVADGKLSIEQPSYGLTYKVAQPRWMQINLRIPRGWRGALDANTITGPMDVTGVCGTDLHLETVTGTLRAFHLQGITGHFCTVSGTIRVEHSEVQKLSLRTISGDIHFDGCCSDEIHLNEVSGDTDITSGVPFLSFDGTSVSGNVQISAPINSACVSLRSMAGRLRTQDVSLLDDGVPVTLNTVSGHLTLINPTLRLT